MSNDRQLTSKDALGSDFVVANINTGRMLALSQTCQGLFKQSSDVRHADTIQRLTEYIVSATEENVKKIKTMLEYDPTLLRGTAYNVTTPSGLILKKVKPYEAALGAGDVGVKELIEPYFDKYEGGTEERAASFALYKLHIDSILTRKPYDLAPLVAVIKNASDEDVEAILEKNLDHQSELSEALKKFRKDTAPGKMSEAGMHCNYNDLKQAIYTLYSEAAFFSDDANHNKNVLYCIRVIGRFQDRLSAPERFIFAQYNLHAVAENNSALVRSYKFICDSGNFLSRERGEAASATLLGVEYWAHGGRCYLAIKPTSAGPFHYKLDKIISNKCINLGKPYNTTIRDETIRICNF